MKTVVYGTPGSYHHQVFLHLWSDDQELSDQLLFVETFDEVIDGVRKGNRAVLAVHNTVVGAIGPLGVAEFDATAQVGSSPIRSSPNMRGMELTGFVQLPIQHCLVARKKVSLAEIEQVTSHPAALAQCREWLATHLPQASQQLVSDTAAAIRSVVHGPQTPVRAAVGSVFAAQLYGGEVVATECSDRSDNVTTFAVLVPHFERKEEHGSTL